MIVARSSWSPPPRIEEYRLLRPLGRGQMGQVFLARDHLLARSVAIKFLVHVEPGTVAYERFVTEARAAARVQHPNVVAVYRVGDVDGRPFIVTEYVRGQSLDALERPMPWPRVVELALGLARGLAAAHRRGVLHRDIKPANVILAEDGTPKLVDFGLAKLRPRSEDDPTGEVELPVPASEVRAATGDELAAAITGELRPQRGFGDAAVLALLASRTELPSASTIRLPSLPEVTDGPFVVTEPIDPESLLAGPSDDLAPNGSDPRRGAPIDEVEPLDPTSLLAGSSDDLAPPRSTHVGAILGTPDYMAPELWRGAPATPASDVYAFGAMLYELLTGHAPLEPLPVEARAARLEAGPLPSLAEVAPELPAPLVALVDRCLAPAAERRYVDGDALAAALDALHRRGRRLALPTGNPYVGLRPFTAADAGRFFGRDDEVGIVLERLRADGLVWIAGDVGVGKTSLVRAGVLPELAHGALGTGRTWSVVDVPSRERPATTFAITLAPRLGLSDESASRLVAASVEDFCIGLRRVLGETAGVVWVLDALDEALVTAPEDELELLDSMLAQLGRDPAVRVIVTVRAEALPRLVNLTHVGRELSRALFVLRPPSAQALREIVTGPLEADGATRFESDAMVGDLVATTHALGRGLGLLGFSLQELWERRDRDAGLLAEATLRALGGVDGAYVAHAERVVSCLSLEDRPIARRLLVALAEADAPVAERAVATTPHAIGVATALVDAHVLRRVQDADGAALVLGDAVLATHWPRLGEWIAEAERARRRVDAVGEAERRWREGGRRRAALLDRASLAALGPEELAALSPTVRRYVDRSRNAGRRLGAIAAAGLACVALAATALALRHPQARAADEAITRAALYLDEARAADAVPSVADDVAAREARRVVVDALERRAAATLEQAIAAHATAPSEDPRAAARLVDTLVSVLERRLARHVASGDEAAAAELRARLDALRAAR